MSEESIPKPQQLPFRFHVPNDVSSRYATNLVVQHTPYEFILSFFEVEFPLLIGSEEETASQLKEINSITTNCIARIVVAPGRMPEFVDIMQRNLAKFQERFQESKE